ncbi:MAG: SpaA isopeptide-forming pilin-related protein, partial [Actinomycetota bacterium]|nr:SpaA isopeptide-forming pilin-related protein [Actinomycetota bacterium]
MPTRPVNVLVAALVAVAAVPLLVSPAAAAVVHEQGFAGTVAGFRSWYGSYGLGDIGTSWCVDHGPPAPDVAHDYVRAELSERDASTRQALAWAVGAHGPGADRVQAAALMLVLHDLMGARYPRGTLAVDRLGSRDLIGFEGQEQLVIERARTIKADAVSRSGLQAPLTLEAEAQTVPPGRAGSLLVRLRDAAGRGVGGIPLHTTATGAVLVGPADATTGPDGSQAFPFTAVAGENRFEVSGLVPDLTLQSFAPRRARAQRVVRPARVPVTAVTAFTGVPRRRLLVRKSGDAAAYLSVAGARFEVSPAAGGPPVGTLVSDATGSTGSLDVPAGWYEVREVEAPPGYTTAGPWSVDLTTGDVTLEAADRARPGRLELTKVDASTGRLLAGAGLRVDYDADRDGAFETSVAAVTTTEAATVRTGLLPGDYQVSEVSPPPGYQSLAAPVRFHMAAGETATVRIANAPVAVAVPQPPPSLPPSPPSTSVPPRRPVPPQASPPRALPRTGAAALHHAAVGAGLVS